MHQNLIAPADRDRLSIRVMLQLQQDLAHRLFRNGHVKSCQARAAAVTDLSSCLAYLT